MRVSYVDKHIPIPRYINLWLGSKRANVQNWCFWIKGTLDWKFDYLFTVNMANVHSLKQRKYKTFFGLCHVHFHTNPKLILTLLNSCYFLDLGPFRTKPQTYSLTKRMQGPGQLIFLRALKIKNKTLDKKIISNLFYIY